MPSNQKQVATHTFHDGIDTSTDLTLIPNTSARYILNCLVLSTGVGNVGIITNVKGNLSIETPLPEGENKTIGTAVDEEKNLFYFFVWNSNGYHTIFQFNELTRTVITIMQSITDTGGFDVLNFSKDYLILMTNIVNNNLLYWVDGLNDARKINIKKALDKSPTGYGANILEEYINAYKLAPSAAPVVSYFSDLTKPINRLYGASRKFASIFGYDDRERSTYSDFSNVVNPIKESFTGVNNIPTDNNGIDIIVQTGSAIVKTIEIAMFQPTADLPNPSWVTIAVLDKAKLNIPDNTIYTYKFYNEGGSYPTIPAELIEKPQSYLPKAPLCQAKPRNSMAYANFNEGFEDVPIDTELSVTYEELVIDDGTENKFNNPSFSFSDIPDTGAYLYNRNLNHGEYMDLDGSIHFVSSNKRANSHKVTIGNDVKKGNTFTGTISNGGHTFNVSYTANVTDTANSVANQIKQQLLNLTGGNGGNIIRQIRGNNNSEIQPERNIYINTDDGFGNISFEFSIIDYTDWGYYGSSGSVNPVQFDSLKDTGQSISNMKLGAGIKFGIMYEDFQGRRSLVYTNDGLITTTATQNSLGGIKAPVFSLTIKHTPPIWAKYYQIVRTKDLTYADFIQMLIQKVITVNATNSGGDYLDLVVGSLYTYQKIHPNTTLQYTFKKGDRIRLIAKSDGTYYPDFETEILSYKDTTTEIVNTNLTVNGTDTITVASATDDNIGRFILVDGNEREIIGRPSPTTYTVNAPIGVASQPPYLSYELVDRRGLLRIRKPSSASGIEVTDQSLVEIFSPSLSVDTLGQKQFFHFNKKFPILNAGKENRYHDGNGQPQSATQDAIVKITEGTVFVRNREMPITNTIPNAQVVIKVIEDESYSDFYYSDLNDNGRDNVEDNKQGVVHFGSRVRFSSIELENTAINGLNDFANLDREDFNDEYGSFKLTVMSENGMLAFKELKDAIIPIFETVIQDNSGEEILGASKKLLNDIRYYSHDGGIGNNPESYCRNEGQHYHVSANSGCYVRLSTDGITPISQIYFFDNEARRILSNATIQKANIYGEYDRLLGCVVWYVEGYDVKTFSQTFNGANWEVLSPAILNPTQAIVTPPTNGTVVLVDGLAEYIPNTNYTGNDSFTYSTIVDGSPVIRKVCLSIVAPPNRQTAWRQTSAYTCVLDEYGLQTGMKAFDTLEEYYTDNGENTGNTKPNDPSDPNYVPPIFDDVACVPEPVDPTPDPFTFVDVTDADVSTMYISNTVTISGINIPVAISITTGEYRINGGAWTSADGTIVDGSIVEVRRLSSSLPETTLGTTLTVGGVSDTFSITTASEEVVELQIVIFDSYQNAYYNDDDTRLAAIAFDFVGGGQYLFTITDDIVRDNIIHTFEIPLSALTAPVETMTPYLTTGSGITVGSDIVTSIFNNYVLLAENEHSRMPDPPTAVGTEYDTPVTLNGITGVTFASGDIIKVEHKAVIDPTAVGILVVDLYSDTTLEVCAFCDTTGTAIYQDPIYKGTNNFLPDDGTPAANCWGLASDLVTGGGSLVFRFEFNLARLINSYPAIDDFAFIVRGRAASGGSLSGAYSKKGADSGNMKMNGTVGSYIPTTENASDLGIVSYSGKSYTGGADGNIGLAYGSDILEFNYNVSSNTLTLL